MKNKAWRVCVLVLAVAGAPLLYSPAFAALELRCDRLFEDVGPVVRIELPGINRDPRALRLKRIRLAHYSLNKFNLTDEVHARSGFQNQDAVVAAIENEQPDVLTLSEMMNRASLSELARRLRGVYETFMIEGNDSVATAVLVRRSLPLVVEIESHRSVRHDYIGNREPIFTRDLLTIHLSLLGSKKTLLSIAASHFKAQKNNFSKDPHFAIKRGAEEQGALEILEASARARSSRARILLGDVNSDARLSNQMLAFKNAGYEEALDILGIPMEKRTTHSHFPRDGTPSFWQTDVAFVSPEIVRRNALVSGYVAADRTGFGRPLKRPHNIEELRQRPSDHQMLIIEIDVNKLN